MDQHAVTMCLGSNVAQAHELIKEALRMLMDAGFSPVECSDIYPSSSGYLNQILRGNSDAEYDELLKTTKGIERKLGRLPSHKEQGIVPIDIDIVVYDGVVKRPLDFQSDYFRQGIKQML